MAKIREIEISYTRVIQLAPFHDVRPGVRIVVEIEEGEDIDKVMREHWAMARNNVAHAAAPALKAYKLINAKVAKERHENLYLGLSETAKKIADNLDAHLKPEPKL